ncbi:MAG: UPF0182 family protein [Chitinispirillaceae bacterium]
MSTRTKMMWWAIAIVAIVLYVSGGKVIDLLTDFLWFKELRLTPIFLTSFYTKIGCGLIVGVLAWLIIYGNSIVALRMSDRSQRFTDIPIEMQLIQILSKTSLLKSVLVIASLVVAFFIGIWASSFWDTYLKFINSVPFGTRDPLFGKDIGFYVFQLPYFRFIYHGAMVVTLFSFLGSLLVYFVRLNCVFNGRRLFIDTKARTHLLVLSGVMVFLLFFGYQFKIYQMVLTQGPLVNGAGYSQIKAGLPILLAMRWISIVAALLVWATIFRRKFTLLFAAVALIVLGTLAGFFATQTVQKFVVGPDELSKETPYIGWSIVNTQAAFGLDKIETRHFVPTGDLNEASLQNNAQTINNIRLWDRAPLLTTYSQLQEIRTYYEFLDVDNDRYMINGQYRQVMFSPRELVPAALPSRIWINEHLTYTHGYGLCLGPVNSVTAEGLPDFFIKNIPPASTVPITVSRPQIYFGEADADYAIVNIGAKEFDYPSGNDNVYSVYDGSGGIRMGSIFRKMLFALKFQELKILLRSDISADSRILLHRQIIDRVQTAVPFLTYDNDPYMVITAAGRLVWIVDGYTTSDAYPYSASAGDFGNYIRNSVKVVIDAYDGTQDLYISDPDDPLIKTWAKVFPKVFRPLSAMPADLRSHIRYPQTLFSLQSRVYSVYHMTDPQVFYNKEDVWRIPDSYTEGQSGPMSPYYTIMKLAEVGVKEEFILMVPFSPSKKENMIAWLAARCDEPNYGKLLVFDFPKQKLVYGPSQIESRINQDPDISKQLTLWNQGGSRVIRGSLLVIPVDQSLIYVQPLYITSQTGSQSGGVPELKRVIVAYENSIAMEPTLEKSLLQIFGGQKESDTGATIASSDESLSQAQQAETHPMSKDLMARLIAEANRQFMSGQEEMKRGNWAGYGDAMKKVERLLEELKKAAK